MGREPGGGPTQRQLKVGEQVRRALAEALARGDTHEPELDRRSITVSEVRMTPDLRTATAFVMPLGGRDIDKALAALGRARGELRRAVSRAIAMKFAPDLSFRIDESYDRIEATQKLLSQPAVRRDIDRPAAEDDDDAPA